MNITEPMLKEYFDIKNMMCSPFTLKNLKSTVTLFFQWAANQEVTPKMVMDYQMHLWKGLNRHPNTVIKHVARLHAFFEWAIQMRYWEDRNPVQNLPGLFNQPSPKKQIITIAEYFQLRAEARKRKGQEWYPIMTMAWYSGMRMGDCCCLGWEQLDWINNLILLRPRKNRAHGVYVEVPMKKELLAVLSEWKLKGIDSPYCFPRLQRKYMLNQEHVVHEFSGLVRAAGITRRLTFHDFRHTFITRLLEADVTAEIISTITGQTLGTVMRYQNVTPEKKLAAITAGIL